MKKTLILLGGIAIIVIWGASILANESRQGGTLGGGDGFVAKGCTVASVSAVAVGDDLSALVIATSSRRAWVRVEQPSAATNTVFLHFNADAAASINSGLALYPDSASASSSVKFVDFGLNTDFPYTGAVRAITSPASSTVLVTACNY